MSNNYLQVAAGIMSECLSGPTGALTINRDLDNESLTIFLSVACVTLGKPRTRRIVTGEEFSDKFTDYQEAMRLLERETRLEMGSSARDLLYALLHAGENRRAVLNAGMSERALLYMIQDASALTMGFRGPTQDPDQIAKRLHNLTLTVCQEARAQIDEYARNKKLKDIENALRVIGGAAARITAAKLTGGVSEVLAELGGAMIDGGLSDY